MSEGQMAETGGPIVITEEQIARARQRMAQGGFTIPDEGGRARIPSPQEIFVLAEIGTRMGLDVLTGQITILGGKPYVTLAGMYDIMGRSNKIKGWTSRPATKEEREAALVEEGEHYWITDLYLTNGHVFTGHGFAEKENVAIATRRSKDQGQPPYIDKRIIRNMAENRSKRRAMVQFLGIAIHDPDDSVVIDMTVGADGAASASGVRVGAYAPIPTPTPHTLDAPKQQSTIEIPTGSRGEPVRREEAKQETEAREEASQRSSDEPPDFPEVDADDGPVVSGRVRREG